MSVYRCCLNAVSSDYIIYTLPLLQGSRGGGGVVITFQMTVYVFYIVL